MRSVTAIGSRVSATTTIRFLTGNCWQCYIYMLLTLNVDYKEIWPLTQAITLGWSDSSPNLMKWSRRGCTWPTDHLLYEEFQKPMNKLLSLGWLVCIGVTSLLQCTWGYLWHQMQFVLLNLQLWSKKLSKAIAKALAKRFWWGLFWTPLARCSVLCTQSIPANMCYVSFPQHSRSLTHART